MMRKAGSFCEEYYELKLTDTEYETAVEDSYNTRLIGRMYFEDSQGKGDNHYAADDAGWNLVQRQSGILINKS